MDVNSTEWFLVKLIMTKTCSAFSNSAAKVYKT